MLLMLYHVLFHHQKIVFETSYLINICFMKHIFIQLLSKSSLMSSNIRRFMCRLILGIKRSRHRHLCNEETSHTFLNQIQPLPSFIHLHNPASAPANK
ncbi:hypothetical protein L1887_20896 [Cichorium endivia]|nr:hypothetical protein L1887_20896 [Cichorium endivia]